MRELRKWLVDWEATSVPYLQQDFRHIWNHEYWCRGMSGDVRGNCRDFRSVWMSTLPRCHLHCWLQRRNMGGRTQKHFMLRGMTYSSAESYSPASRPISGKSQMTPRNAIWEVNLGIFILAAGSWCLLICYVGGRVTSPLVAISGLTHHFLSLSEPVLVHEVQPQYICAVASSKVWFCMCPIDLLEPKSTAGISFLLFATSDELLSFEPKFAMFMLPQGKSSNVKLFDHYFVATCIVQSASRNR